MNNLKYLIILTSVFFATSLFAQITAPGSSASFQTTYSAGFISAGGVNDNVFIFCGTQSETNIGQLSINASGCDIVWYMYDGISFVELGQTGQIASNLESGFYMARQNCGGSIICHRAWVWVNRSFVDIDAIPEGCQTFNLQGYADALDTSFEINDPPGSDFIVDENTYIKVCFWANHTYVSDIGFYLKSPGNQAANPGETGVVQLCPAASDWGPNAAQGSWTGIPWSALGCSDPTDENTVCNSGNNVNAFCFQTHGSPGGGVIVAGSPTHTPCVCDLPTPLTGNFASVGPWTPIYGSSAATPGWAVQIYDCKGADIGSLTRARITFIGETECGEATFEYDSGTINSPINDNSCDAASASLYIVPPSEPQGTYTINSSITSTEWSSNPAGYTSSNLSNQIVSGIPSFPNVTTEYILTITETIDIEDNPLCQNTSSETFVTLPADATITPVNPMCVNSPPVQLTTVNGGGTWTTNAPTGSIANGYFYPEVSGPGTYTATYTITGPCEDTDQINITVYNNIEVINFSDTICTGDNNNYNVTFSVVDSDNNPAAFYVDLGTGTTLYNGSYAGTFTTNTIYNITVTDLNGCNEFHFNGLRNCGCTTNAGNMTNLIPVNLCQDECSNTVTHNGLQVLDTDDIFEFAIHNGAYPALIYATNDTPEFCFTDFSEAQFGVTYYISAICGDELNGHVSQSDPCYSQSMGTPVIWYENPIAHIAETEIDTCGLSIRLTATPPAPGMTGSWSANGFFTPTGGSTVNSPTMNVLAGDYGDMIFTWTIYNGICSGSDNITAHFYQTPTAYAGENSSICGNQITLNAVPSLSGSSGYWSGPGSFDSASNPNTSVTSNFGTQIFTWRETQGSCWDEDHVAITFIREPFPTTTPNVDSVCGEKHIIQVINSNHPGMWTAYENGNPLPSVIYLPSNTSTTVEVTIGNYTGFFREIEFVWTETNQVMGVPCSGSASKVVVFAKKPIASVGSTNESEICGTCVQLAADVTGSEWATGFWIGKDVFCEFDDVYLPNAVVCIDSLGSFGDTAYVRVPFIWAMKNYGCTSMDTMWVTFYDRPTANAGLDRAVCGKVHELGAVYDISETANYSPSGWWSTYQKPLPEAQINIQPQNNDTAICTVSHNGIYQFIFRENNSNLTMCYDTDTVKIEFVEIPVISAGEDHNACGTCTTLGGTSGGFDGSWLANGSAYDDYEDPNTHVCQSGYGPIVYTWLESNQAMTDPTFSCSSKDTVIVTYWRIPTANILTDTADSTTCGLRFNRLRAENPGSGIRGYWYTNNSATDFGDEFSVNTWTIVPNYGYHDFYWIEETGPAYAQGFCTDTAGPLRIHFIQIPNANAGIDTLFCGYTGTLDAIPSVGTGVWSTPSVTNISFEDQNDPNTQITSNIINTGNPSNPYFNIYWTEDNTNGCTDRDTIKVTFARIPTSDIEIIPPKCFGEPASIKAVEDTLQQFTWNFYSGVIDSTSINSLGGQYENFVYWNSSDTLHRISLITTNHWNCQSTITIDTVYEPAIPTFDVIIVSDTCMLGKGGLIFADSLSSNSFFWLDTVYGPPVGPVTAVYNLPAGEYDIRTSYQTPNMTYYAHYLNVFNSTNCVDIIPYTIEPIGMIEALIEISTATDMTELVAPEAQVIFLNNSIYDNVSKRCEWHFGDGTTLKNCDPQVEHIYTEAGCFDPFLIVMNRDLVECRDTAYLEACIPIDNSSKLEVPNIFSPNADGYNDFFQVKAQTLRTFSGIIVNRYGRTVYEWENWQDYEAGWDGTLSGGTKASPGVYYFIIKAVGMDDQEHDIQGPLHLMRD
ncbi:MAG: gliding motility-associated C-terminal domain-containing protein [Bacteroidales bacterium]|nr:gliding motility-associated C-terminal domain-containing protein [Bacteroidales bacterium]